jgi:RNA polymerase sigma-70 factor, ECF subfamily
VTVDEQELIFHRWIHYHLGLMLKVVRAFAGLHADQDDLLQDVLINVWSSIPAFRGDSKESTWIYRVAIQTAMVWKRGERRRRKTNSDYLLNVTSSQAVTSTGIVCEDEQIEQLYEAIRHLPKFEASIAVMHLDGLTYREIAAVVGITENYVGVTLSRIRKDLSSRLGQSFIE